MVTPLARLAPGQTGRIVQTGERSVEAGDPEVGSSDPKVESGESRRLADLGFVPGTRVRVIRRAPLGDPVELELRGFRVCLRRADLGSVYVELEA